MTKEEAIICLKGIKNYGRDTFTEQSDWQNSLDMAIKALEQQPSDDCVSRQAVFETIEDCNSDGLKGIFCSYNDGERFKEYIKKLPTVTPTHGTCKDCNLWRRDKAIDGACFCSSFHTYTGYDFYCADFEKRGNSDGSN